MVKIITCLESLHTNGDDYRNINDKNADDNNAQVLQGAIIVTEARSHNSNRGKKKMTKKMKKRE